MKKLNVLAVTVALLFVPVAFAGGVSDVESNYHYVQWEKLDSGLGELGANYTGAEFMSNAVLGESLDSGLGELGPDYTGAEFMRASVLGEKLDSGLGELTQEEIDRVVAASRQTLAASSSHKGE